uniref:USP domain-containing protein n=1 Tax=Romanomermis culicivorax TaxID=13658 RepID=A0A915I773_ROMCU
MEVKCLTSSANQMVKRAVIGSCIRNRREMLHSTYSTVHGRKGDVLSQKLCEDPSFLLSMVSSVKASEQSRLNPTCNGSKIWGISVSRKPDPSENKILYSLYGIVSHSGRLSGGHYVAYVKLRNSKSRSFLEFLQNKISKLKNKSDYEDVPTDLLDRMNTAVVNDSKNSVENDSCNGADENGENDESIGQWYYISDSYVNAVTEEKVMSCEAYLMFYERIF